MELSLNSRFVTFILVLGDARKREDEDEDVYLVESGGEFDIAPDDSDEPEDISFGFQVSSRG